MPSVQDLVKIYQKYSDQELIDVYTHIDDYSEEAKQAVDVVLNSSGGLKALQDRLSASLEIDREISRLDKEIAALINQGINISDIKNNVSSSIITTLQIETIIEETSTRLLLEKEDKKIKPRTVIGGIIGGFVSGTLGGILWGVMMIYSRHIFYIFGLGLFMLSYGMIRFATRQSKKNSVVIIMTVISVVYALVLGFALYGIFGYLGAKQ